MLHVKCPWEEHTAHGAGLFDPNLPWGFERLCSAKEVGDNIGTGVQHMSSDVRRSQEALETARRTGDGAKAEPLASPPVEPSAEEGASVKKSKKRKAAEAQALQAQADEAAAEAQPAIGLAGVCPRAP
jgi:hypothetical protein